MHALATIPGLFHFPPPLESPYDHPQSSSRRPTSYDHIPPDPASAACHHHPHHFRETMPSSASVLRANHYSLHSSEHSASLPPTHPQQGALTSSPAFVGPSHSPRALDPRDPTFSSSSLPSSYPDHAPEYVHHVTRDYRAHHQPSPHSPPPAPTTAHSHPHRAQTAILIKCEESTDDESQMWINDNSHFVHYPAHDSHMQRSTPSPHSTPITRCSTPCQVTPGTTPPGSTPRSPQTSPSTPPSSRSSPRASPTRSPQACTSTPPTSPPR
ncbi:hypothetical protein C8Q80DRAFT_450529 [Daedaleopsis nitida]|nr:hypothetical protein C8Q80DRAFT_450529 [Daedaleopsis nitida]